jgi:ATP-binding cassette, subfamily B, beta-glucan exporter
MHVSLIAFISYGVSMMKFLRLYVRALALLGPEARLGWALAVANLVLASAHFVEPILFGRIVDMLANSQGGSRQVSWPALWLIVGAWVGFALFIVVCSTLVALQADRLAHRHSQKVRTDYFEHILQLPLAYHMGTHSGRLMKVMLTGTTTLSLWLSFFREQLGSFVSFLVLMPLTLFLNWRFGLLLIGLCVVFAVLIAFIL